MKAYLEKYQIIIFFALTLIISWIPWYTGGYGFNAWGPSMAGLIVVAMVGGWKGIVGMLRSLVHWRVAIGWWAVALLAPVVITIVAIGAYVLTGGEAPPFTFWKQEWHLTPLLIGILLSPFGGPGGEEPFGWRGYAQSILQGKWGPLVASVIIGIFWGVWHLPEFFNPTSTQYAIGIGFFGPMIIMWIASSMIMTWLFNKTGGSVLVAGVIYHLMLDFSSSTLLADLTLTGLTEGIPPIDVRLLTSQIMVSTVVALALLVTTKGRLGKSSE